jgi:molybdopterin-guanine dinucleotide biosynthesis protein A
MKKKMANIAERAVEMTEPLGVILAGGLSRRMAGPEKSLLELNNKPLVKWVKDRLSSQTEQIILNANGNPERLSKLDMIVQSDTVEGYAGPLAGILAGMKWAKANTSLTHIITAAADTPFFPDDYVKRMTVEAHETGASIALASSNDRKHPVFGLWPVDLADELEKFIVDENNRKVMMFVERYPNCMINFNEVHVGVDPFFNVNTPDDMEMARKIALGFKTG